MEDKKMSKLNFFKGFVALICFALAFSIISPSLAFASESQAVELEVSLNQEPNIIEVENESQIDNQEINTDVNTSIDDLNGPRADFESEVQPNALPVIPLLAGLVIRQGVSYIVKTSSKRVLKLRSHASDQAVDRGITGKMIDDALTNGTKYVDVLSGERVAWIDTGGNQVAVLLKKDTDVIDTVYFEDHKKLKWFKSNWKYVGDYE
ncbi:hypothetical protein INQ55_01640 [Lysinibacillus sphaericus]|nr:hypothetical protein INQ55_01640 [Lysinibacillus sphaericus]